MSGEGPESIPTSADRRSRRPVKKRALTPVSAQAAQVDALFVKPDQEIRIPTGADAARRRLAVPPEIVSNVQGSSSGAGSGEFHVYKASRRREYARLRQLEEEAQKDRAATEFEEAKRAREAMDEEKTKRNREKREKAKARKAKIKKVGGGGGGNGGGGGSGGSSNGGGQTPTTGLATAAAASLPSPDGGGDNRMDEAEPNGDNPRNGDFGNETSVAAVEQTTTSAKESATAAGSNQNGVNGTPAAVPEPVPIADGPGLLIQDDDD
ncbi:DUF1168 domain containing protein [Niveomyces insectorum RCEF 264]|uniref:DUF1168 domain containing protein n=1 Tax=Niveomyces insectorum RCEF 264 TaxID=1081102 RepID=A0A167YKY3_9HYPO|nr:DUF1168 domain containing protein [Niveomyces insectorum RCEF 264]